MINTQNTQSKHQDASIIFRGCHPRPMHEMPRWGMWCVPGTPLR